MPEDRLSAREAALIAQARAELQKKPEERAGAAADAPGAGVERPAPAAGTVGPAPGVILRIAPKGTASPPALDPAARAAALMAAARAETEHMRRRRRQLYVWAPVAFMVVAGLWTLLWMWL